MSFSCTVRPLGSKQENSKCFSNSRSTLSWPPRFFSTETIDPVAEALRLVRVELDVDLGDDVVLLVEDEDDVGLVVDGRRAAQVEVAQARGLEALLVGGHDGDHRHLLGQRDVLEPVDDVRDLLGLVRRAPGSAAPSACSRRRRRSRRSPDSSRCCWTSVADVLDRARRLRAAQQEQVLAVAGDPVERRAAAAGCCAQARRARSPSRHPGPEDLLADVLDLDRAGLVRAGGRAPIPSR